MQLNEIQISHLLSQLQGMIWHSPERNKKYYIGIIIYLL